MSLPLYFDLWVDAVNQYFSSSQKEHLFAHYPVKAEVMRLTSRFSRISSHDEDANLTPKTRSCISS